MIAVGAREPTASHALIQSMYPRYLLCARHCDECGKSRLAVGKTDTWLVFSIRSLVPEKQSWKDT